MDPITLAIIAALSSGVTVGAEKLGEKIIGDAYHGLKSLIKRKFGSESKVSKAVQELEENPQSEGRKTTLIEEIATSGADKDNDILELAKDLIKQIESNPNGKQLIISISGNRAVGVGNNVTNSTFITGDRNKINK